MTVTSFGVRPDDEQVWSVRESPDGGYVAGGWTTVLPDPPGPSDALVIRAATDGSILWPRAYGGPKGEHAVVRAIAGGFYLAGWSFSFGTSGREIYVLKLDSAGTGCSDHSRDVAMSVTDLRPTMKTVDVPLVAAMPAFVVTTPDVTVTDAAAKVRNPCE